MYYIGLDVHRKTISFCVKDAAGRVLQEGRIGSSRHELDAWIRTLPQPRTIAMEATIFTGWIYDHLLPHAEAVKVPQVDAARAFTSTISLTPCRRATWTREGRTRKHMLTHLYRESPASIPCSL